MENVMQKLLLEDIGIPDKCFNVVSKDRAVALVADTWLRSLQNQKAHSLSLRAYSSLVDIDTALLLAPSNSKLPKQWSRVSIKVIPKQNVMVQSLIEEPLCELCGKEWGHTESLASIASQNRRNVNLGARQRYKEAVSSLHPQVSNLTVKAYNDVIREAIIRLYGDVIQSLQQLSHQGATPRVTNNTPTPAAHPQSDDLPQYVQPASHPGLQQAYGLLETPRAFFIVQTYHQHTLWETVVLSPTLLIDSYAKPLFILYQVLRTMKDCHEKGTSLGDLHMRDVFLDQKLWAHLCQPHVSRLCQSLPSEESTPTSSQQNRGMGQQPLHRESSFQTIVEHSETGQRAACWANAQLDDLPDLVQRWVYGRMSNFDYLMALNKLAGRRLGDPNHHPVLPWVMDFSGQTSGFRDLTKSKYRLNKGDPQLDLTYETNSTGLELQPDLGPETLNLEIPHHISDILSDITYYVYKARQTPKSVLCAHVRSKWVPNEYPSSMERLQEWTPDECIPEFFTDPEIFTSTHEDLPDLELPSWASSAKDFIRQHKAVLEGPYVSARLHHWIDLTFGYKLSGNAAVKAKNVYLQLVDKHTNMENHGVVQLFSSPHPQKSTHSDLSALDVFELSGSLSHDFTGRSVEEQLSTASKKDSVSLDKRRQSSSNSLNKLAKVEEPRIVLPLGYDPLAPLVELESMMEFCAKVSHTLPSRPYSQNPHVPSPKSSLVARDMQAFGCLATEFFLSPWLRGVSPDAPLDKRYQLVCKVVREHWHELPRPSRQAIATLLRLHKSWSAEEVDQYGALFQYENISTRGLPPPDVHHLLQPSFQLFHFPVYFSQLYAAIHKIQVLDQRLEAMSQHSGIITDRHLMLRKLAKEKVSIMGKFLYRRVAQLGTEGLQLVIPYVTEMCVDKNTAVFAMWTLFNPIAQALGPVLAVKHFQPLLTQLFNDEDSTPKHMKLYHRSFVIQLIVRLSLQSFLRHFATLFVEAAAGYRDFSDDGSIDRQISNEGEEFEALNSLSKECQDGPFSEEVVADVIEAVENGFAQEANAETAEDFPEVFEDEDMMFGNMDGLKPPADRSSSGSPSIEDAANNSDKHDTDSTSISSVEPSDEVLGKSVGACSAHSVSRLIQNGQRCDSASSAEDVASSVKEQSPSDCQEVENASADAEDFGRGSVTSVVRTQGGSDFRPSILDGSCTVEYNISDVAAETIKWMAHRLGPVLTAQYLSGNLLRMLALCYIGEEQLQLVEPEARPLSTTKKRVLGDVHASRLLDCLGCIAVLYGEQIILLQYFNHVKQLVQSSVRRLTMRMEAGLIGSISLLIHILPYISDATLLDILQETIFRDIFLPLLKMVSAVHVSFPTGHLGRRVICYKLVDALYIISLRIGFEMTREHMTFVLQKFFAAFNRVYEEKLGGGGGESVDGEQRNNGQSKLLGSPTSSATSEAELLYMEMKLDKQTKEYKIGKPVSSVPIVSPPRQSFGSLKHSLLPPSAEETADEGIGESNQEQIVEELRQTFTPELAHAAYIPFCKLAGGIHMEQNLINDDLIRKLCAVHDAAMTYKADDRSSTDGGAVSCVRSGSESRDKEEDSGVVSGSFGRNVQVSGNQIVLQDEPSQGLATEAPVSELMKRRRSGESSIDYSKLKNTEMEANKQRHLKGNWLAYWEHEVGHSDREHSFDFKQIKLQTFMGHSSSVRSLSVLDNENSFVSASKDKTVKLWSLRNVGDGNTKLGCQWTYNKHKKSVFAVTFLDSLRLVASCDSAVHVWDPFIGMCVHQFESAKNSPVTVLAPLPAPSTSLVTATTDCTVRLLDIRVASFMHEFKCTTSQAGMLRCATVSPDGTWLAVGYSSGVISVLDSRTGMMIASWKGHEGEILQIKAYNKKSFVTSSLDTTMSLWSVEDARAICSFRGLAEPVHCVSFYRKLLISGSTGNRVSVHPISTTQLSPNSSKLKADAFRGVLSAMALLPLNRLLLLGADNGAIRLLA